MNSKLVQQFFCLVCLALVKADFTDYFSGITRLFSSPSNEDTTHLQAIEGIDQKIPYEVSIPDQKFISQAIKLTGVEQSELDTCQHRVVLKLQTSCHKMNDEQLAKLAVALLNCQSQIEGRKIYPCTENMSIKDCTIGMDADTWNTYHLMSNRARAVCYSVRQVQFRGITEQTVNKLMEASRNQISTLGKISKDQENLQNLAQDTLESVSKGYKDLADQQEDLQKAQLFGQMSIEDNIKRLADEKKLIAESHDQLSVLTQSVHNRLEKAAKQLEDQTEESRVNHRELLDDMMRLENLVQVIFQRIEESSKLLLQQSEMAAGQYDITLKQLSEVNQTVHSLVTLMGNTKQAIDERLNWITTALGGTDLAVERLAMVLWHAGFLLMAMVACAFLSANLLTRFFVAILPPLNLALCLNGSENAQGPLVLSGTLGAIIIVQTLASLILNMKPVASLTWKKKEIEGKSKSISPNPSPSSSSTRISQIESKVDLNSGLNVNSYPTVTLLNPSVTRLKGSYSYHESNNYDDGSNDGKNSFDKVNLYEKTNSYENTNSYGKTNSYGRTNLYESSITEELVETEDFANPTPPNSRNGFYPSRSRSRTPSVLSPSLSSSQICNAKTRKGTPCKLNPAPGRDFCYKHQHGDSVMGS